MEMPQNESILIDTDAVVRKVNHGKLLPRPIMSFIRKLVHEEDFNRNFRKGLVGWEFVEDFFRDLDVTVEVIGEENIPAEGLFTFVSNHPLGGADAGIEIAWLAKKYDGKVITAANAFLLHIKQLANYLIPVNKMSSAQSRELVQLLDQAFKSERQVLFFPAGACSRKIDGKIQDLPWQKTFVTKSRQTHRDVIPIWFSGQNSKRFYRLDKITGFLGIGQNLAMFTLPDEMFRCRGKHFKMVIGKPIPWESFTSEKTDLQWAACVREKVYELAQ
ncbi:MAG: 1-acyl-sn-glycerol-3-phosphate acyltransferase [Bacteroidales bacterium]|jgi:putative hemolysin|nr:1-acyl-sn-glycerol-3-phosphate acyltransferase [Bacteroidales bacterium]